MANPSTAARPTGRRRPTLPTLALAAVALTAMPWTAGGRPQEEPPADDRAILMRRKLDHAQRILGGLAEGRLRPVARSAGALREISEVAAAYNLPTDDYRRYSQEFRRLADSLADRAEADDLDGASLAYLQLTINCVDCHKYVRIVQKPRPDPR